jgi:heme/copper-type cytochrome/quinol oxidase subunit 2
MKNDQKFRIFPKIFSIYYITVYEILLVLVLIIIKFILNSTLNYQKFFSYEAPFYDSGTLMSLLICLEHLFVSYYLIIIIIMVYWSLYIFIVDFVYWNTTNNNYLIKYKLYKLINIIYKKIMLFYINIYIFILKNLRIFREKEYLLFLNLSHINFSRDSSIPKKFIGLFPFHFKKKYLNRINILNILSNNLKHYDILGRSLISLNLGIYKFNIIISLIKESIYLLRRFYNFTNFIIKRKMNYYLYYSKPKSFFFAVDNLLMYKKNDRKDLTYSYSLTNLRSNHFDIFSLNHFRHSGMFEAIWAAFPTIIIISILIPSLILLYSFEDILNPKLSIKVIGNQWYWSYEFNNWINFKLKDKEIINKNIYISYAFNSVIVDTDNLNLGYKRLLEVDNRLVLPTNTTIRFLVSSSDVLHSFAMPELGFKVDANPGRLNQILIYISRPGVYYGQCSELCGTSHAFMPIVIQAVTPKNFINYLEKVNSKLIG